MSNRIFLDLGAEPWNPSAASKSVFELDFYNFPRAGVIEQNILGTPERFLYVCAAGEEDDTNIWFYAPVSDEEIETLAESIGDDVVKSIAMTLKDRRVDCALAQDWRIAKTSWIDAGSESPVQLTRRFARRLLAGVEQIERNLEEIVREADEDAERELASA